MDDEGFLEIAIALSLQDPDNADNPTAEELAQALRGRALQTLQGVSADEAQPGPSHQAIDAVLSDDEASSAATTLKTPPVTDQVISESTGSGVDSTTADGDSAAEGNPVEAHEQEQSEKCYVLRCTVLERMIDKLDKLDNVGGVQAIPFMQVVHMLTMDLDGNSELGQRVMYKLLSAFIKKLEMVSSTPASEVSVAEDKLVRLEKD